VTDTIILFTILKVEGAPKIELGESCQLDAEVLTSGGMEIPEAMLNPTDTLAWWKSWRGKAESDWRKIE
jgi:hypothetical protein